MVLIVFAAGAPLAMISYSLLLDMVLIPISVSIIFTIVIAPFIIVFGPGYELYRFIKSDRTDLY